MAHTDISCLPNEESLLSLVARALEAHTRVMTYGAYGSLVSSQRHNEESTRLSLVARALEAHHHHHHLPD